jgi:uncharacterized protein (DUF2384 family)
MAVLDRAKAHRQSTRTAVSEMVAQLNASFGTTLVALLSGASDRKQPLRWAERSAVPRMGAEQRIRAAHEALILLTSNESAAVARAWFIGTNPLLDDKTPIELLRDSENNAGRVVGAAAQFLSVQ